jgi:hypothetical protein
MKYTEKKFTVPVAGALTSQINWDIAFLSVEEFIAKYGKSKEQI